MSNIVPDSFGYFIGACIIALYTLVPLGAWKAIELIIAAWKALT